MKFMINGREYTFRGTISVVPGDNLASQYLGGYKALNSALRKCRHCLAVQDYQEIEKHMLLNALHSVVHSMSIMLPHLGCTETPY